MSVFATTCVTEKVRVYPYTSVPDLTRLLMPFWSRTPSFLALPGLSWLKAESTSMVIILDSPSCPRRTGSSSLCHGSRRDPARLTSASGSACRCWGNPALSRPTQNPGTRHLTLPEQSQRRGTSPPSDSHTHASPPSPPGFSHELA